MNFDFFILTILECTHICINPPFIQQLVTWHISFLTRYTKFYSVRISFQKVLQKYHFRHDVVLLLLENVDENELVWSITMLCSSIILWKLIIRCKVLYVRYDNCHVIILVSRCFGSFTRVVICKRPIENHVKNLNLKLIWYVYAYCRI